MKTKAEDKSIITGALATSAGAGSPVGAYAITAVTKTDESDADFADEVARTRKNAALMALLEDRSNESVRISSDEARRRLGIE